MRLTGSGITSYEYIRESDSVVVHGPQCLVVDQQTVRLVIIKFIHYDVCYTTWKIDLIKGMMLYA